MQLAPNSTLPARDAAPALGSITLGWYDRHGDYMVRRTTDLRVDELAPGAAPAVPAGATIADAVRLASEASRANVSPAGTPVGRAYGVLQAADGALSLRPLRMELEGANWPVAIDGPLHAQLGASEVSVRRTTGSLLAVVGSTSWIDLTLLELGRPQQLPT